jgi:spore coat protein H
MTFAGFLLLAVAVASESGALTRDALFTGDRTWDVHLTFSADQWKAMEPEQKGPSMFGGPPFGGPGRNPNPEDFGPGMFLGPAVMRAADTDRDGTLARREFESLAEHWFQAWDKEGKGQLKQADLETGLNRSLGPPEGAGPPGGPGGRGGPGAPRGPGSNLQGREGTRNGLASAMGIEFRYVHADLDFGGRSFRDVAVRYKGNGTWLQSQGGVKRSMKIDLNRYVKGQKLAGVATLNLHNCVTDASWMNEVLSYRLFRDAGVPAPRTAYARVYVTVPGQHDRRYFGLYSLVENIDEELLEDRYGTRQGELLKPVTPEPFTDLGDDWASYRQTYDPKTKMDRAAAGRVMELCKLVSHADAATFRDRVTDYLDLDEVARFMAVTVWLSTLDSILGPGQNFYVRLAPATGKMQFLPWDLDHSFGQFPLIGTQEQRENLSIAKPWQGERRFLERLFGLEAFQSLYRTHLREIGEKLWKPERLRTQVDQLAKALRPAVQEEDATKLERFDKAVAGETVTPEMPGGFGGRPPGPADGPRLQIEPGPGPGPGPGRAGGPAMVRFGGPPGFMPGSKPIKAFVQPRAESVTAQLEGQSTGDTLQAFGFGGPRGPGGSGGPGDRRERGSGQRDRGPGPGGFGPGTFLAEAWFKALDANRDGVVTKPEFEAGFAHWFETWDADKNNRLSEEELRRGMNREWSPFRGGPPGEPGFGPPAPGP